MPSSQPPHPTETITLGGGCFWCLEAVFARVLGVLQVESGYSNGHVLQPSYEQVCTGQTGHVEVVRVVFDPAQIDLRDVLQIFFAVHDPTSFHAQGHDVGPQYRSGIYWHSPEQAQVAQALIEDLQSQALWPRPIVTELLPVDHYWRAEDEHQNYFDQHPQQGYCSVVITPKLSRLRQTFASKLRASSL